jgi:hypothetical protein
MATIRNQASLWSAALHALVAGSLLALSVPTRGAEPVKVALVIGEAAYTTLPPLLACAGAANVVASALRVRSNGARQHRRKTRTPVGPIAKRLLESASRKSETVERLCETLALSIQGQPARSAFLGKAMGVAKTQLGASGRRAGSATASPIPAADIERVQRDPAKVMGPISRVLGKRALGSAASPQAVREVLAVPIESAAERAAFLKLS